MDPSAPRASETMSMCAAGCTGRMWPKVTAASCPFPDIAASVCPLLLQLARKMAMTAAAMRMTSPLVCSRSLNNPAAGWVAAMARGRRSAALAALEGGGSLRQEGRDALSEVLGAAGLALGDALVLQLVGELGVEGG